MSRPPGRLRQAWWRLTTRRPKPTPAGRLAQQHPDTEAARAALQARIAAARKYPTGGT